jgi:hypothetical protein
MKITCTSCHKPLSIDETKLPMKEVAFPCPACKTKLTIDRRTLGGAPAELAEPAAAAAAAPAVSQEIVAEAPDDEDDFGSKALIVGVDHPGVRQAARQVGFQTVHHATADAAREYYLREYPPVVFLLPQQLTPPPLAEMAPLTSVATVDRRKGFFILVADNLKTLDGNAAFLYNVNLVVATKDLGAFRQIHRDADKYHKRLYQSLNAVVG